MFFFCILKTNIEIGNNFQLQCEIDSMYRKIFKNIKELITTLDNIDTTNLHTL